MGGNDVWCDILSNTSDHTLAWASSAFDQGEWSPTEEISTKARKEDAPLFDISSTPPNKHHQTKSKERVKITESCKSKQSNPNHCNTTKQTNKTIPRNKDVLPIQNIVVETNDNTWIGSDLNPNERLKSTTKSLT